MNIFNGVVIKAGKTAMICSYVFRQRMSSEFRTGTDLSLLPRMDSGSGHRELTHTFLRALFYLPAHGRHLPLSEAQGQLGLIGVLSLSYLPNPRPKAWVFLSCKMKMVIVVIHLVRLPVAPRHHSESTESIFPGLWEAWQSIHVQSLGPTPTSLPLTGRVHLGTYTRACVRTQS